MSSNSGNSLCVDLFYIRSTGDASAYEARLADVAQRFGNRLRVTTASAGELSRLTRDRVFISGRLPNIVLVWNDEVVAQAIGELSSAELERVLRSATHDAAATVPFASSYANSSP